MKRFIDKSVFCLAFFIVSCIHTSHAASMTYDMRISVSCQAEFAALNQSLKSAIKDGRKSILVDFVPGVYEIRDQHLVITKDFQNVDVTIHGNGSRLVGIRTKCSGTLSPEQVYTRNDQIVDCWGSVVQSPAKVEVVDKARKICRVKRVNGVSAKTGDIIQFSQWYLSPEYEVSNVAGEYIYFIAKDLAYYEQYCDWNVNYDYVYGKEFPRYRVFNTKADNEISESSVICFLNMTDASVKTFSIDGLTFEGCAHSSWLTLFRIKDVKTSGIRITNCTFEGCKSLCISINNTKNVTIDKCHFKGNYRGCVSAANNTSAVVVSNCVIEDDNKAWANSFSIKMCGTDFKVSGNEIRDFGYGAIGVGVWYGAAKTGVVSGIVEKNEIYYSPGYYADYKLYTLMDSGAIYTWTQNDDVIIRYNHIHDYIGMDSNRGIFCDDGTQNVKIYGNVITNIANSFCIDLRACPSVEAGANHALGKVNVGNEMRDNVVDGRVRFEGRSGGNNGCVKGKNIVVVPAGAESPKMKVLDVDDAKEDVVVNGTVGDDGTIKLSRKAYKKIKSSSFFNEMKKWISK